MTRWFLPGLLAVGVVAILAILCVAYGATVKAGECAGITGKASYYCCEHHGRPTASGAIFNEHAMTAAMVSRNELGRTYRVTSGKRSVVVKITDVGPAKRLNRLIDLSIAAFSQLADPDLGVISVCVERIK